MLGPILQWVNKIYQRVDANVSSRSSHSAQDVANLVEGPGITNPTNIQSNGPSNTASVSGSGYLVHVGIDKSSNDYEIVVDGSVLWRGAGNSFAWPVTEERTDYNIYSLGAAIRFESSAQVRRYDHTAASDNMVFVILD